MLNPAIGELIENYESRYALVLDVAARARHIAEEAEENGDILIEKPVSLAIDQINNERKGIFPEPEEEELPPEEPEDAE